MIEIIEVANKHIHSTMGYYPNGTDGVSKYAKVENKNPNNLNMEIFIFKMHSTEEDAFIVFRQDGEYLSSLDSERMIRCYGVDIESIATQIDYFGHMNWTQPNFNTIIKSYEEDKRKTRYEKDMEEALVTGFTKAKCDVCGLSGRVVYEKDEDTGDNIPKIECDCGTKPMILKRKKFYINITSHLDKENHAYLTSTSNVNVQEITTHNVTIDSLMESIRRDLLTAHPELMPRKMDWIEENEKVAKRRGC